MIQDPIVEETRQARQAYLNECGNSLLGFYEDLKRQEGKSNRAYFTLKPKLVSLVYTQKVGYTFDE